MNRSRSPRRLASAALWCALAVVNAAMAAGFSAAGLGAGAIVCVFLTVATAAAAIWTLWPDLVRRACAYVLDVALDLLFVFFR
jgi:hypothetical protein